MQCSNINWACESIYKTFFGDRGERVPTTDSIEAADRLELGVAAPAPEGQEEATSQLISSENATVVEKGAKHRRQPVANSHGSSNFWKWAKVVGICALVVTGGLGFALLLRNQSSTAVGSCTSDFLPSNLLQTQLPPMTGNMSVDLNSTISAAQGLDHQLTCMADELVNGAAQMRKVGQGDKADQMDAVAEELYEMSADLNEKASNLIGQLTGEPLTYNNSDSEAVLKQGIRGKGGRGGHSIARAKIRSLAAQEELEKRLGRLGKKNDLESAKQNWKNQNKGAKFFVNDFWDAMQQVANATAQDLMPLVNRLLPGDSSPLNPMGIGNPRGNFDLDEEETTTTTKRQTTTTKRHTITTKRQTITTATPPRRSPPVRQTKW